MIAPSYSNRTPWTCGGTSRCRRSARTRKSPDPGGDPKLESSTTVRSPRQGTSDEVADDGIALWILGPTPSTPSRLESVKHLLGRRRWRRYELVHQPERPVEKVDLSGMAPSSLRRWMVAFGSLRASGICRRVSPVASCRSEARSRNGGHDCSKAPERDEPP